MPDRKPSVLLLKGEAFETQIIKKIIAAPINSVIIDTHENLRNDDAVGSDASNGAGKIVVA